MGIKTDVGGGEYRASGGGNMDIQVRKLILISAQIQGQPWDADT